MRLFKSTLLLLVLLGLAGVPALAGDPAESSAGEKDQFRAVPARLLVLGPLPTAPEMVEAPFPRGTARPVLEITPGRFLPRAGEGLSLAPGRDGQWQTRHWEARDCDAEGRPGAHAEGIHWLAATLRVPRRQELTLHLAAGLALFVDGREVTGSQEEGSYQATTTLTAGWHTVWARAQTDPALWAGGPAEGPAPVWSLDTRLALTDFADLAGQPRAGGLAISDDGRFIARKLTRREPSLARLDVLDAKGRVLAGDLGGGKATPLGFFPGGHELLLRRSGSEGTDLQVWDGDTGAMRTLLRDEPGLGLVKMSPDGRHLLLASTAGLDPAAAPTGNRRYVHLRERVDDFTPEPHLHLLDVASGARRQLTAPADLVLDDAVFSADGAVVYFTRTLSQTERPWFHSEIVALDLAAGGETVLARFTGGWEVRPHGLAASPDGRHLVFLGPPEQVGGGRDEHNVYNKQLWVLDLAGGEYRRVTPDAPVSFDGGGGLPRFDLKGRLLVMAGQGSRLRLARLDPAQGWSLSFMNQQRGSLGAVNVSPDGDRVVYTASPLGAPPALYQGKVSGQGRLLEGPAADWSAHWVWSDPEPAGCTAEDGTPIEAWFYPPVLAGEQDQGHDPGRPVAGAPAAGRCPLVVYYYGGSTPTMQGFNGTHQFFAANGYGVLVVNPRGAHGYGDAFADFHAGDWGPAAAADVMAATRHILARHPWLDDQGIGIYGGSYGGFLTEYLVTATDMFAAAVSMYGISDLATYWGQGTWGWTYGDMALAGATPWADPRFFVEHSPLFRADRINTPLLLLHGQDDGNVTPGESQQLFTALSVLNRPVEMVLFPGEDHGISGTWENRVEHRTMILEWFDRYCRGEGAAWEARWED